MALQPGDEFAGYRIISLLGRGGMGQVYLVENPHLRRREALKVISAAGAHDADFQRRFTQEAQTAAALSHPAIVTIYHYGVEDETPWFTMEHLDGANPTHQSLTTDEVIEVAGHVAAALDYAHRRHVVHRDIKPANIIVLRDDDGRIERAVVLDFGIAKLLDATGLTASSAFIGTLAYTAPEIIDGHPASPASDQYALACTIYELLCGTTPFTGTTPSALMMAHISKTPPSLQSRERTLTRFDGAFARPLSKNPTGRYRDCRAFAWEIFNSGTAGTQSPRNPSTPKPFVWNSGPSHAPTERRPAHTSLAGATQISTPNQSHQMQRRPSMATSKRRRSLGRVPLWTIIAAIVALVAAGSIYRFTMPQEASDVDVGPFTEVSAIATSSMKHPRFRATSLVGYLLVVTPA
ncbi:serine/threonine-protein kinase [Gordonia sp. VNK1]|uniref:serine/threonine-protein kinase n=1 Tax=Gordonia oleivorans TaxID=3156618 RepID=UPI0032B46138